MNYIIIRTMLKSFVASFTYNIERIRMGVYFWVMFGFDMYIFLLK